MQDVLRDALGNEGDTFEVSQTVLGGGYSYRWGSPRVMESYPVQVSVELIPVPPGGYASDALVEHEVRGEWPMRPPVGSVTITCGDHVLGWVSPVPTAL